MRSEPPSPGSLSPLPREVDTQLPAPSFHDSTSSEDPLLAHASRTGWEGDVIASARGERVTQAWLALSAELRPRNFAGTVGSGVPLCPRGSLSAPLRGTPT